ncbi:hypothetical protein OAU26_03115 [Mariniblastus sp.]|nr:hypothetical protein [Mariniblastus sp.]
MSQVTTPEVRSKLSNTLFAKPLIGRLSWKKQLKLSGLPEEVQSILTEVMSRCWLTRGEKAYVIEELIAHFVDGMDRDVTAKQLVEDFGDPAVAAKLIQSSKRKNRPFWKKSLHAFGYGIIALIVAYAGVWVFYHQGVPVISTDYVVQLNSGITEVADSQKAWPIYRPMWTKYKFSEGEVIPEIWFKEGEGEQSYLSTRFVRKGEPGWEAAKAAFYEHQDLIDAFREGAKRPYFGIELKANQNEYSEEDFAALFPNLTRGDSQNGGVEGGSDGVSGRLIDDWLVGILLPHVQQLRNAARLFAFDIQLAIEEGDSDRVVQDIETMLGLARHAAEGRVLVCGLVGYAISGMALSQIESIVIEDPDFLNEQQLQKLQLAVRNAKLKDWISYDGESLVVSDLIQRIYTNDGQGDGRITPQGFEVMSALSGMGMSGIFGGELSEKENWESFAESVIGPLGLFAVATRGEVAAKADQFFEAASADLYRPMWVGEPKDIYKELNLEKWKYAPLGLVLPATENIRNAMDRLIARQEGVLGAIALQRFYLANGAWPNSWDEIPKSTLPRSPVDQITGKPLCFKIVDESPLIYGLGYDLDDDGGVPPEGVKPAFYLPNAQNDGKSDGDWIVWPTNVDEDQ